MAFLVDDIIFFATGISATSATGVAITSAVGTGLVVGGLTVGTMALQSQQQKKAQKSAEKKSAAAQAEQLAFQKYLAGEADVVTAKEMIMQQEQRKLQSLFGQVSEAISQPAEPRVLTLPAARPQLSIVDQVNSYIDNILKGAA